MFTKRAARCSFVALVIIAIANAVSAQEIPDLSALLKLSKVSAPLTEKERALAIRLAEKELEDKKFLPARRVVLTEVHVNRDIEAEKKGVFERHAVLIYYQYAGDLGIQVDVNLVREEVEGIERFPHLQPAIAPEELARARELVFADPQLRKAMEPYQSRLTVEGLLTSNQTQSDGLAGHRLIYLLFRVGPHYLTSQGEVLVDLSSERVLIQPPLAVKGAEKH
jgi:Cu2+-containing amine oxidase